MKTNCILQENQRIYDKRMASKNRKMLPMQSTYVGLALCHEVLTYIGLLHSLCILVGILDVNEERRPCFQNLLHPFC